MTDYSLVAFAQDTGAPVPLLLATDPGAPGRLRDFLQRQLAASGPNQAALDFLSGHANITGYTSAEGYYADVATSTATPAPTVRLQQQTVWPIAAGAAGLGLLAWWLA